MFEVLPLNCEVNFHECRYNGCAVAKNTQYRNIFERIFQKSHMDFYVCNECKYMYLGQEYNVLFDSLDYLNKDNKGFYLNSYKNERLYLSENNLKIVCDKKCKITAWVQIYKESI